VINTEYSTSVNATNKSVLRKTEKVKQIVQLGKGKLCIVLRICILGGLEVQIGCGRGRQTRIVPRAPKELGTPLSYRIQH
jgi:hypothetical protein